MCIHLGCNALLRLANQISVVFSVAFVVYLLLVSEV